MGTDKAELERIFNSRSQQRYHTRLLKNVNKRYGKYWNNHYFENLAK